MLDEIEIDGDDDDGEGWFSWSKSGRRTLGSGAIFLASIALLFWNEGFSKRHSDAIAEVGKQVVAAPRDAIDPTLEGKPVHLSAKVTSQAGARDNVFNLRTNGVALYRQVQMFQWIEYEESSGRGRRKRTEYVYDMDWDSEIHDSSQFHEPAGHQNPKPALDSDGFFAADARFGPYKFDNQDVAEMALVEMETPDAPGSLGRWPAELKQLPDLTSQLQQQRWYKYDEGTYYRGNQASEEYELGDLAVTFYELSNDYQLSMIAGQKGDHLESWKASNGDSVLLAAGGIRAPDVIIADAVALGASRTSMLRSVGLIGAVIGAAGIARLLGGFLSMIPVVGSIVQFSLMVAGALFGLLVGVLTIVVGWLSARPWVAGVITALLLIGIVYGINKGRSAEGRKKRLARVASVAAAAKQRVADKLGMPSAPMGLATAGAGASSPPPPPGSGIPSRFAGRPPVPPAHPIAENPEKDLAPLEWTPGLAPKGPPPAVMEKPKPVIPPTLVGPPSVKPQATRMARPFDAVDEDEPLPTRPLFDTVEHREPPPMLFDTVEPREVAPPPVAPPRAPAPARPAPLFDTVEPRDFGASHGALFDTVEPRVPAPAAPPPKPVIPPPPAPAPAPAPPAGVAAPVRISLGSKGEYSLNKIVRKHDDGVEELLCYELMRNGKPVQRGTQEQIRQAFKEALAGS